MIESLVLPVQIAEEMLGSLGQIQDRLQVDDLRERRAPVGKLPRQQFQNFPVFFRNIHIDPLLFKQYLFTYAIPFMR